MMNLRTVGAREYLIDPAQFLALSSLYGVAVVLLLSWVPR